MIRLVKSYCELCSLETLRACDSGFSQLCTVAREGRFFVYSVFDCWLLCRTGECCNVNVLRELCQSVFLVEVKNVFQPHQYEGLCDEMIYRAI